MRNFLTIFLVVFLGIMTAASAWAQDGGAQQNFNIFQKRNLVGGDLRKSKPGRIDRDKCESLCKLIASCKAFSYRSDTKVCHLKKEVTSFEENPAAVTGIDSTITPPAPPPCSTEAFDLAKRDASRDAYTRFIAKCKTGPLADKAKLALKEIMDREAWETAETIGTCSAFKAYLNEHPSTSGRYFAQATRKKEQVCRAEQQLVEKKAWEKAKQANNCTAYKAFLEKYPSASGEFYQAAKDKKTRICNSNRSFTMYDGKDLPGGDMSGWERGKRMSLLQCKESCSEEDSCIAFTYNTSNRHCFLKDAMVKPLKKYRGAVSGILATLQPPAGGGDDRDANREGREDQRDSRDERVQGNGRCGPGYDSYENADYFGNDIYRRGHQVNFDACRRQCDRRSSCVGFSFITRTARRRVAARCWIKDWMGKQTYKRGIVSCKKR